MTGLRTSAERTQASPPNATQWNTGFPFQKIVYVGDVSGTDSFGLRYAQKLAHEYQAELVVVHSLDPVVYALPGTALGNPDAEAELTAMDRDPHRHGANHDSFVQREQVCAEILAEARRYSASLIILGSLGRTTAAQHGPGYCGPFADGRCTLCYLDRPHPGRANRLAPLPMGEGGRGDRLFSGRHRRSGSCTTHRASRPRGAA